MADDGAWEVVRRINRAWTSGDLDDMAELFHPDVVVVHPNFEGRSEGREACVGSYRDFAAQATVKRLDEFDPQVDVFGDTAVVTYGFQLEYEMGGAALLDRGRDLFVLRRRDGSGPWQVIWRTLVMEG